MYQISALLSARLFQAPRLADGRIYFISNLSGRLSLYAMDYGGSIPQPLLPPDIALPTPMLVGGSPYEVFPKLNKIVVMLDHDGDENYQPVEIPLEGGFPIPSFNNFFAGMRVHLNLSDTKSNLLYFNAESRTEPVQTGYQANLATGELVKLDASPWGAIPIAHNEANTRVVLGDAYTAGDVILNLWKKGSKKLISGKPLEERQPGEVVPPSGINSVAFAPGEKGLLLACAIYDDAYSPAYLKLKTKALQKTMPVKVKGIEHKGMGELVSIEQLANGRYGVLYNIDGCSWLYEAKFDPRRRVLSLGRVVCGKGDLTGGVLNAYHYDGKSDSFCLSFSTATSPAQIYTVEGKRRKQVVLHTREKVLGIDSRLLSPGEDASFISFDGRRISARLYLPSKELGFQGKRPLVYWIHGGPQDQTRPDFTRFSVPLIQFLTLNGFAVFDPNVRGSTGYGLDYTKQVDHDWGGRDRMDHAHAMQLLAKDERLDTSRAAVVGGSYGGYMTLTLAARHPELWQAAVDLFGPYNLLTFLQRIPETWKPYFEISLGHLEKDHDFLVERSPQTYIDNITCPLLVVQGKNDPRVVEPESRDLVEHLRQIGKQVDYLVFENEGHGIQKYENRIKCYTEIAEFIKKYLKP
jgi:dipeptidyl aminopeptidase/acylaminoacyl peptidase